MANKTIDITVPKESVSEEDRQATKNLLLNGALQNHPEELSELKKGTTAIASSTQVGIELSEDSAKLITKSLYQSQNSRETFNNHLNIVYRALIELGNAVTCIPDTVSTQQLYQSFDEAIKALIAIPSPGQDSNQRIAPPTRKLIAFLKCTTFTIHLVKLYIQEQNQTDRILWVVETVGNLLIRAATSNEIYEYIRSRGGWDRMYTAVHHYTTNLTSAEHDQVDHNGGHNLLYIYGPMFLAVIGISLSVGYIYIRYR